jgi:hypothetical protein
MEACIEITGQVRGCVEMENLTDVKDYTYRYDLDRNGAISAEEVLMGAKYQPFGG